MPADARETIVEVMQSLKSIAAMTDRKFVAVGECLTPAIAILERISAVCEGLGARLASDELRQATANLTRAASQVSEYASSLRSQRAFISDLKTALAAIRGHTLQMQQTMSFVAILVKNGKIQAANVDKTDIDFSVFTKDAERIVTLAGESLAQLDRDLIELNAQLQAADRSYGDFEKQQSGAIDNIPRWLAASVDSAAAHGEKAAKAAITINERSRDVSQKVGAIVVALQIGDTTRQRIEHVEHALGCLSRGFVEAAGGNRSAYWDSLSEDEWAFVVAEICRLEIAQLVHAAEEFERDIARVIGALKGLVTDARAILNRTRDAYGASDRQRATFLMELQENVGRALDLLRGVRDAREDAHRVVGSVLKAVMRSANHVESVKTLEIDLRLLGLNMTFKCNHLVERGRALSTIAQELRVCADRTTDDAQTIAEALDSVTKIAEGSAIRRTNAEGDDLALVETIMTDSERHFGAAGRHIAEALAALAQDGETVVSAVEETAGQVARHLEIADAIKATVGKLEVNVQQGALAKGGTDAARHVRDEILTDLAGRYTMASERAVHSRLHSKVGSEAEPCAATAMRIAPIGAAAVDDIFF